MGEVVTCPRSATSACLDSEIATKKWRSVIEIIVVCDGRGCNFCGCKDSDNDPVDLALHIMRVDNVHTTMAWFTDKPRHECKNEGMVCFYCYSVFNSRYKHTRISMKALLEWLGKAAEELERFKKLREGCVTWCIQHGGRTGRKDWALIEHKVLSFDDEFSVNYEDPVDEHWDFHYYLDQKGHPDNNGLGHKTDIIKGRKVVIVPGPKIWKARTIHSQKLRVAQTLDTGNQNFSANQVEEKASEMIGMMQKFMPQSTGMAGHDSLSSLLLGVSKSSGSNSSSGDTPASAPKLPSNGEYDQPAMSWGFGHLGVATSMPVVGSPAPKHATRTVAKTVPAAQSQSPRGEVDKPSPGDAKKPRVLKVQSGQPSVSTPGGGGQPTGAKKTCGRPKKDSNITAETMCKEFSDAEGYGGREIYTTTAPTPTTTTTTDMISPPPPRWW